MKAYISLPNNFDLTKLVGQVNFFEIGEPIIYSSIDKLLKQETQNKLIDPQYKGMDDHFIALIEFTDPEEILQATMSAYMGNTWKSFKIRLLETIVITKNQAA